MTKNDLSEKADISISFLSYLTNGKGNPSLKTMEAIAKALDVPLPALLETTDLDRESLDALAGGRPLQSYPRGYERVSAVLPEHQAYIVKKWAEAMQKKLRTTQ